MKLLCLHQNFPGQYKNLVRHLARQGGHEIVFITQHPNEEFPGIRKIVYKPARKPGAATHHYLRELEGAVLNGQAVARVCDQLRRTGFRPDIVLGHNGWGEPLYVKDIWPDVPLLGYFEFFYRSSGSDVGFEPAGPPMLDDGPRLRTRNSINLLGLDAADWGQAPTRWQRDQYPAYVRHKISVIHEGVDTRVVCPKPDSAIVLAQSGIRLTRDDEVVTYVARNLEPYRGFHMFMRAVPIIQRRHPKAHVVIVGGDDVSYGRRPPVGKTWRQVAMDEVGAMVDPSRLHFLGKVPYGQYLSILRVSSVHVYLTYPFVLSWSMLEAMSTGCVVVGSSTPPVLEVLRDGENGLLVDFFAPEEIAKRVDEVLEHPTRMQPLRDRARATVVRDYDAESVCIPKLLGVMGRMMRGDAPHQETPRLCA